MRGSLVPRTWLRAFGDGRRRTASRIVIGRQDPLRSFGRSAERVVRCSCRSFRVFPTMLHRGLTGALTWVQTGHYRPIDLSATARWEGPRLGSSQADGVVKLWRSRRPVPASLPQLHHPSMQGLDRRGGYGSDGSHRLLPTQWPLG